MKTIITTVLLITMLPIMCQQRQMSLDVTFDKEKKCLTFTFKNNDKNLEAILRHSQTNDGSDTGSFYDLNIYDKNNKKIGYSRCMYHPTELYLNFLPGEIKKSNISLLELKKGGYVKDLDSIYKIQLHCVVYSWTFKRDDNGKRNKELYEKVKLFIYFQNASTSFLHSKRSFRQNVVIRQRKPFGTAKGFKTLRKRLVET